MTKEQGTLFDELPPVLGPLHRHPLYNAWRSMKTRCYNPKVRGFKDYGGRGIFVCDEWRNSLRAFVVWAIKAGWQSGLQLDRENNDGPYSPGNCRWVTRKRNMRNCRNTLRGPDGSALADHAENLGMTRAALRDRVRRGMPWADVVSVPKSRPGVRYVSGDGVPVVDLARASGLSVNCVLKRIARGWSPDDAVSIPKGGKRPAPEGFQPVGDAAARVVAATVAQRPAAASSRKRKAKGSGDA